MVRDVKCYVDVYMTTNDKPSGQVKIIEDDYDYHLFINNKQITLDYGEIIALSGLLEEITKGEE